MHQPFTIDTSALTTPVTKEERQQYKGRTGSSAIPPSVWIGLPMIGVVAVFVMVGMTVFDNVPRLPIVMGGIIVSAMLIGILIRASFGGAKRSIQRLKFAEANGFVYHQSEPAARLRGVLFGVGGSRTNRSVFQMHGNVRIGNYSYTTGSGKNRQTHNWRYIEVPLPRNLPHLVLDSKDNNSIFGTNLPVSLQRSQRLDLEGDFNDYFTLYAPSDYGFDVRYILPPDTMALLIDNLARFDLEFIDNRMMIVADGSWSLHSDEPWRFVEWVINVLHPHIVDRTDRYVDERAQQQAYSSQTGAQPEPQFANASTNPAGTVSASGRRLKRGFPIGTVIFVVVIAAIVFIPRLLG